jgi:hypothetical protein
MTTNTGVPTNPDGQTLALVVAPVLSTTPHAASKILYGSGAPSASIGVDGDFYRNLDNDDMYGPKLAGAWPDGYSIRGFQGDPGPAGPAGLLDPEQLDDIETSAEAAAASAAASAQSAVAAAASATAANTSKVAAGTSATNAAASETASNASKVAAAASATAASGFATQAASSNTGATTAATDSAASATAANASKIAAGISETNAAASAVAANTSKVAAGVSEGNAAAAAVAAGIARDEAQTAAQQALQGAAPIVSPAFTGNPTAPTPATSDNDTSVATTAFVKAAIAAAGGGGGGAVSTVAGRTGDILLTIADVTGGAPLASPTFTGDPKAPTPATSDNDTSIATTAFVKAQAYAPLLSPALTGTPTAPTAAAGTSTTQLATTAFVTAAMAAGAGSGDAGVRFVESFPSGGTDDTTQLTNALAWLQAAPRRTLAMQHNKAYTLGHQITVQGASWFRIEVNGATIKAANGMPCQFGDWMLNFVSCTDGVIVDLNLDGNRANRPVVVGLQEAHNIRVWNNCKRITFVRTQSDNGCCDGFYIGADDVTNLSTFPTDIRQIDCGANNSFRNGLSLINSVNFEDYRGAYNNSVGTAPEDGVDCEPNGDVASGDLGNINPRFYHTTANGNSGLGFQIFLDSNHGVKLYDVTASGNISGAVSAFRGGVEIYGITLEGRPGMDTDRGVIDLAGAGAGLSVIKDVVARDYITNDNDLRPIVFVDVDVAGPVTVDNVKTFDCDCPILIANSPVELAQNLEAHGQMGGYTVKLMAGADQSTLKGITAHDGQLGVYVNAPDVSVNDVKLHNLEVTAPLIVFDTGALRPSLDGVELFQDAGVPSGQIGVSFAQAPVRATNIVGHVRTGTAWTPTTLISFAGGTTGSLIANNSPSTVSSGVAPLASPAFTGNPTAPTPATSDNDTSVATTAFVKAAIAAAGTGSGAPLDSPVFTGNPTAPTPATSDNDTSLATTAFVKAQAYAPLASPAFTGNPTAPTPSAGDNDTSVATTAFVTAAIAAAGTGGGGTTTVRQTALRNWKKSNTSKIAALMGRGQSGFGRGRILGIGDSFTAGFAGAGTSFTNGRSQSFLTHLARAMAARGMKATADWAVGDGNSGDVPLVYDPRLVLSGGASLLDTSFKCLGGSGWTMDGTGNRITFTPVDAAGVAIAFDTVEVLVMCNNNTGVSGNFDVFYNGNFTTPAQTVTSNDIMGVKKVTLTVPGAAGTTANSVTFQRKTNTTFIAAVGTRVASKPGIEIINAGSTGTPLATYAAAPGSTSGSGDSNTWNTRAAANVLMDTNAVNVTFINGWYNDKDAASTIAATQTQLANLITAAKAWGDVVFIGYAPLDPSDTTLTLYNQWQDAMYATCIAADIPIIDPPALLPVYATGVSYGLYGDSLHLNGSGHALIARSILEAMSDIA